ncbi:MAG: hypothetical protein HQL08_05555 [Nitrospirae bacterium]|nr:hypothetical protein [Nitrospirota bacterium]
MKRNLFRVALFSLVVVFSYCNSEGALPGNYLMAFHACDKSAYDCSQTTNHKIYLAYSEDGLTWTLVPNFTPFQGSVPDIVIRGNTLYFYTPDPDKVTKYNISSGTTTSSLISMTLSDGSTDNLGDVSAYLDPTTNRISIFYLSTSNYPSNQDPQLCTTCTIRSATEVVGSDGVQFTVDDGDRVSSHFSDNNIFSDGTQYLLYFGQNANVTGSKSETLVYASPTYKGTYTRLSSLTSGILTQSGSVPSGYYDKNTGKYWTYITVLSPSSPAVIKRAVHADFSRQLTDSDFTTVMSGTIAGLGSNYTTESPDVILNTSSSISHTLTAPSTTTVYRGETFGPIVSSITNGTSSSYSLNLYASVYTPKGSWVDTVTLQLTLPAGQTVINSNIMRYIPSFADAGTYYFCEYLYDTSWTQLDYKCINFTVQ